MSIETSVSRERMLQATGELAEAWGGEWSPDGWGGRLLLPVVAGIRRGVVAARLSIEGNEQCSRLEVESTEGEYALNRNAVVVLTLGALGGIVVVIWPFFPQLASLAGVGALLALLAWFMVSARLQNSGLEEFLADLEGELQSPEGARERASRESVR